jgi:hypothetical protein
MTTQTAPTVKQYLEKLASQDTNTERDEIIVSNILHKIGFPAARIVVGIVYLEGEGQPTSIQHVAGILVDIADKAGF